METKERELEFGYIRGDQIYLKAFAGYPERRIGQVKESEEASIAYFENRFAFAKSKVDDLESLITQAVNKGSYLMKLLHMKDYLAKFDGLGDYVPLFDRLDKMEVELRELIATNRVKNLEIKTALLTEARGLLAEIDNLEANLTTLGDQMKDVKQRWIKTGAVDDEHHEEVENTFNVLYKDFFEQRKNLLKVRTRDAKNRIQAYRNILYKVEDIKFSDDFEHTFALFRDLQNDWKNAGKIPHKKAVEMWEKFKKANDVFFTRYKLYRAYKEQMPDWSAIEIRTKLQNEYCIAAEALVNLQTEDPNAPERAKELLMQWKNLTNTFRDLDAEVSERFRLACDKIFEFSYLMRVVRRKYPDIDHKPQEDQFRIKISFMRELVRKDEQELQTAEMNAERIRRQLQEQQQQQTCPVKRVIYPTPAQKQTLDSLAIQKRKVKVKKQIVQEMEAMLNQLKKRY